MKTANKIKELIISRENGDKTAQAKIDALMDSLPKIDSSKRDHEEAEFYAKWY